LINWRGLGQVVAGVERLGYLTLSHITQDE